MLSLCADPERTHAGQCSPSSALATATRSGGPAGAPTFATAARLINPIETDSAEVLALYDGSLEPELRRPYRGHVAAGSRPDDDDVKFSFGLHRRFCGLLRVLATRSRLKSPGADAIEQVDDVL
jgi:hypothetical protein